MKLAPLALLAAGALLLPPQLAGAQTPALVALTPLRVWSRAEFRLDAVPVGANNFDPDQIAVDATITAPSGASETVPAFWYQEYALDPASPATLKAVNAPCWHLRCMPTEAGSYQFAVHWRLGGREMPDAIAARFIIGAGAAQPAGWVRVAPDHRYFETSDGRPLRLIGENVCWPEGKDVADYDRWFERMSGAGENFARIWLCPWFAGLEHTPGTLNRYALDEAWKLDHVFDVAEARGIYLLLSLDHHGMYQVDNKSWGGHNNFWAVNPYSSVQGGPCETPNDFFTSPAARAIYEKRLRYLVARYGYSHRLLAWQFFNEIDNVFTRGLNGADVIAWHRDMARWLRAHDPYGHLITTSLTGGSDRPQMWTLPEMDFSDYHSYSDPAPGRKIASLSDDFVHCYGKPVLIDEFGVSAASWEISSDPYLRGFRQALWSGALGGSVGTSMSWWWQDIDRDRAYTLYATLDHVLHNAGWREGRWEPARVRAPADTPTELGPENPAAEVFDASLALNIGRRLKLTAVAAIASPLAAERSSEQLSRFIYGTRNPELAQSMTLIGDFDSDAALRVRVNSAASDNHLVVRLGGVEVFRRRFAAGPMRDLSSKDADYEFEVALPRGRHALEIVNEGSDFTALDSVRLHRVRAVGFKAGWDFEPEVVALRSGAKAVVYVTSPWIVYPAGALRYNPQRIEGKTLTLLDWPDGPARAFWVSPATGNLREITRGQAEHGVASLPIPSFNEDLVGVVQSESTIPSR